MIDNENTITYVIDTNVLIGFSLWCPIKYFNDFWEGMEKALQEKKWIVLDVVIDEVHYYPSPFLKKWLQKQKTAGLVIKVEDSIKNKAVEINSQYPMIDGNTGNSTADTYIIAFALKGDYGIFTRESERKSSADLYKIPDVCRELKIRFIKRPEKFLDVINSTEA